MDFEQWFTEQHGKKPSAGKTLIELQTDYDDKQAAADRAQQLYQERRLWEEKFTSALYAWQAKKLEYHRDVLKLCQTYLEKINNEKDA
jgi:hypothetical protein